MSGLMGKRTLNDVTWTEGNVVHKAVVAALLGAAPSPTLILRDAFGVYRVARCPSLGHSAVEIIGGPITVESALAAAEAVVGGHDHGSVAALIATLALGVIVQRIERIEGDAHAADRG